MVATQLSCKIVIPKEYSTEGSSLCNAYDNDDDWDNRKERFLTVVRNDRKVKANMSKITIAE